LEPHDRVELDLPAQVGYILVGAQVDFHFGEAIFEPRESIATTAKWVRQARDEVYRTIRAHQDFQGRHYYHHFGGDPSARDQYKGHPAYELAERFADEWDQAAFDPDYDTLPLEHFEPRLRELFANPKSL
jgi:predicted HD phosphohydrolase